MKRKSVRRCDQEMKRRRRRRSLASAREVNAYVCEEFGVCIFK